MTFFEIVANEIGSTVVYADTDQNGDYVIIFWEGHGFSVYSEWGVEVDFFTDGSVVDISDAVDSAKAWASGE